MNSEALGQLDSDSATAIVLYRDSFDQHATGLKLFDSVSAQQVPTPGSDTRIASGPI